MAILLIDADIIAYKAAASAETPVNWGDGHWTLHAFEEDVTQHIDYHVDKLVEEAPVMDCIMALSDTGNFRKKLVCDTYKANRKDTRKPMLLPFAKEYITSKYNTIIHRDLEADDTIGILASSNSEMIVWSEDKDLLTIPAKHWIDGEVVEQTLEQADYMFYYQTLIGDPTDNYKGCPKVGSVTAHKLLQEESSWDTVVEAFVKRGQTPKDAIKQARLARILRKGEYDMDTGEVKLWNPQ